MELVNSLPSIFSMVVLSDGPITTKMGSIAFEESRLGGSWLYKLGPEILTNHTEVMRRFMSQLSLKEEDLILLDRASRMDFARPLLGKWLLQSSPWCFIQT